MSRLVGLLLFTLANAVTSFVLSPRPVSLSLGQPPPLSQHVRMSARVSNVPGNRFGDVTYDATVVAPKSGSSSWPPLLLVPPVGLGIDKSFYDKFCESWVRAEVPGALHAPDILGTGSCQPYPSRRDPPLTPAAWATQLLSYVKDYCGGSAVVLAQGGTCPIALEMASQSQGGDAVLGIVLCGPPNLKRLNELPTQKAATRSYRVLETPLGLAFYRFARTRAFLRTFSENVLFADNAKVDKEWVEGCHERGRDLRLRHAVFSVLSGASAGREQFKRQLNAYTGPALLLAGKDVEKSPQRRKKAKKGGAAGSGSAPSYDPLAKLLEYTSVLQESEAATLPGWNVLPYESASEVVQRVASFVERRFAPVRPPLFGAPAVPRVPMMAGNWKLNPPTKREAEGLADAAAQAAVKSGGSVEVVVFVPSPFLVPVARRLSAVGSAGASVGAQDCYFEEKGAFTGEMAPAMARAVGATYVLVGHSERRALWGDKDDTVAAKLRAALGAGLKPVLCVGETKDEYESSLVQSVCEMQLAKALNGLPGDQLAASVSIAYEPVWAIGTGLTATPAIAQSVQQFIRGWLARRYGLDVAEQIRILYGGSVTPETVDALMECPDIDGCLVGGASLDAAKFGRIVAFTSPVAEPAASV